MTSELLYTTSDIVRKASHNISEEDITNTEIDEIITRWEHNVHVAVGRVVANPWLSTEDEYETVQTAVIQGASSEIMSRFDDFKEFATGALSMYKTMVGSLLQTTSIGTNRKISRTTTGAWLKR